MIKPSDLKVKTFSNFYEDDDGKEITRINNVSFYLAISNNCSSSLIEKYLMTH